MTEDTSLTQWIQRAADGQAGALEHLFQQLYPELRRIAHARLYPAGATAPLGTTELVHESFLRLSRALEFRARVELSERLAGEPWVDAARAWTASTKLSRTEELT